MRMMQALFLALGLCIVAGLIGWLNQSYLIERWSWFATVRPYMQTQFQPYVLTADAERALKPGDAFREAPTTAPK